MKTALKTTTVYSKANIVGVEAALGLPLVIASQRPGFKLVITNRLDGYDEMRKQYYSRFTYQYIRNWYYYLITLPLSIITKHHDASV